MKMHEWEVLKWASEGGYEGYGTLVVVFYSRSTQAREVLSVSLDEYPEATAVRHAGVVFDINGIVESPALRFGMPGRWADLEGLREIEEAEGF